MSTDIELFHVFGVELTEEEFKKLGIISEEDWELDLYEFGVKFGFEINKFGISEDSEEDWDKPLASRLGWTTFTKRDPEIPLGIMGGKETFLIGWFFLEKMSKMGMGDGTGGVCVEGPSPTELESVTECVFQHFKSKIPKTDLKLYAISRKC